MDAEQFFHFMAECGEDASDFAVDSFCDGYFDDCVFVVVADEFDSGGFDQNGAEAHAFFG